MLAKQSETRSDKDGQFTLRIPGELDEPVQLRIQPCDNRQPHDCWVSLSQTHLSLHTVSGTNQPSHRSSPERQPLATSPIGQNRRAS